MQELLKKIREKHPFIEIEADESSNKIEIMKIRIPMERQNLGIGSDVVKIIQDYAKSVNKPVVVRPAPEKRHKKDLERFYKRLGFVHNKGRNMDYALSSPTAKTMYWKSDEKNLNFKEWLINKILK